MLLWEIATIQAENNFTVDLNGACLGLNVLDLILQEGNVFWKKTQQNNKKC